MTYAQEIAQAALQRAQERRHATLPCLTKANLALSVAEATTVGSVEPVLYAPQRAPKRRSRRLQPNLRAMAFAEVLADGAALLAAKSGLSHGHQP